MNFDVQNTLKRVAALLQYEKYKEAEQLLKQALEQFPDNESLINRIVYVYRKQDKLQAALDTLAAALDSNLMSAYFYYEMGNINNELKHVKAALMSYAKAIELDPDYVPAYNNLGVTVYNKGEKDKAVSMFQEGLNLDAHNALLYYNYGVALEANDNFEEAAIKYRKALEEKPKWAAPLNNLGLIAYKQEKFDEAAQIFTDLIEEHLSEAEAHNNRGAVFAAQGQISKAIAEYKNALDLNPSYSEATLNLAHILESKGDIDEAIKNLERVISFVPDNSNLKIQLVYTYIRAGRYDCALSQIETISGAQTNKLVLMAAGEAQLGLGNDDEAKAIFNKILALYPHQHSIYLILADINHKNKKYKATEEQLKAYLAVRPKERGARLLLGTLYNEMWNLALAIQIFEDLLELSPDDSDIVAMLTKLYTDTGAQEELLALKERSTPADLSRIKDLWQRVLKQNLDPEKKEENVWLGSIGMIMITELLNKEEVEVQMEQNSESINTKEAETQVPSTEVQKASIIISSYKISGLLRYLLETVEHLPPKGLEVFKNSDVLRSMNSIINVLEKRKGLLRNVQAKKQIVAKSEDDTD